MSNIDERLINPEYLPETLWDKKEGCLKIVSALVDAYRKAIESNCLEQLCDLRDGSNPPIGGITKERTDKHFAQAFDGSVARLQLALLDPKSDAIKVSNAFIESLAGYNVSITDAPCGALAATLSYLATIAELRSQKILPRLPLDVYIIGAELSEFALNYAKNLLKSIHPFLAEQAIFVSEEFIKWDVTDNISNTKLIRRMTLTSSGRSRILLVANFNGFLEKERKRTEAEPQLGELFRHSAVENSIAIWIEPDMNRATNHGGLFSWLISKVQSTWKRIFKQHPENTQPIYTSHSRFYKAMNLTETPRVTLAVMRFDLESIE